MNDRSDFRPGNGVTNRWRGCQFTPTNPRFPVEVFLSIVEYEYESSLENLQSGNEFFNYKSLALQGIDISSMASADVTRLRQIETWPNFKSTMLQLYSLPRTDSKVKADLVKSLVKGASEDPRHFLIRCQHLASLMRGCECPKSKSSIDEWTRTLFLAGIMDWESAICHQSEDKDLQKLADLLRLSQNRQSEGSGAAQTCQNRTASESKPFEEEGAEAECIKRITNARSQLEGDVEIENQNQDGLVELCGSDMVQETEIKNETQLEEEIQSDLRLVKHRQMLARDKLHKELNLKPNYRKELKRKGKPISGITFENKMLHGVIKPEKKHEFQKKLCEYESSRNSRLKSKLTVKPFRCNLCDSKFGQLESVRKHIESVHLTIPSADSIGECN